MKIKFLKEDYEDNIQQFNKSSGTWIYDGERIPEKYRPRIKNVIVEDSVMRIGLRAFRGCESLQSVTIPDSTIEIGESAFDDCKSLQSITIPNSVTTIGSFAFYKCTSLQSITIPNSITRIGQLAFWNCTSIKNVYYSGTEDEWDNIRIGKYNELLLSANIHYNSKSTNESYKFRFKRTYNE